MEKLVLRKANINDLKIIQNLNNKLFEYETEMKFDNYVEGWALGNDSAEYFKDLINNQFVIIAEINNKPIGYLAGSIYEDNTFSYYEGKTCELENMFIDENFREYGIGSKLMNSFLEWCRIKKANRVFVTASYGNNNAIAFYKKHGFADLNATLIKEL